jgi:ankyrin repeat protein
MAVHSAAATRAMLAAGADPFIASDEGITMLHIAAHLEPGVTAALLGAGLPLESNNQYSWTPLMFAAHAGNAGVVEQLLAAGANPASRNSEGLSVLQVARNMREADHTPHDPAERFRRDRIRVVALLEAALARQAR